MSTLHKLTSGIICTNKQTLISKFSTRSRRRFLMALVDVTNKVGFRSELKTCYHSNKAHSLTEETGVLQNSLPQWLAKPTINSRNPEAS